ncbi:cell division cycle protein 91 [Moniliophthora roreri MCA 2997]|uniref:Cell division cycle protein 91 n=2 Tax=Moniliophthora roreri TaxID=221103 RepID=V2YQA3_MONRO|nr:cell division cycle protein 91 [Moniliophthora roreri MCA 2997]KAI3604518.1 cell division cycle protein 91 [Moniliophthora roreri]
MAMANEKASKSPSTSNGSGYAYAFPLMVLARLAISLFQPFTSYLVHDHQLSSPLTSYRNLQEGIYLFQHNVDPYSGGVFRHSPLYLSLFSTIIPSSPTLALVLWTLCDVVGAYALVQIYRARQGLSGSGSSRRDALVGASYLFNPYLFLPSLALSTSSFENALAMVVLMLACKRKTSQALLTMSFLIHVTLSSVLLVAPVFLLLLSAGPHSHLASPRAFTFLGEMKKRLPLLLGEFLLYFGALTGVACVVAGGTTWVPQTWGASLTLPDLTPNTGLWWYFFTEMFDHFRPFFLMVFSVHLLIYVAPMCIKFQHDPLYAAFLLFGVLGTFKAYPTLSDPGLFITLHAIFPEIYPYMRYPIVTALLHLHASLLLPLFHHLWLGQGTGNANFFYASTLVFGCANGAGMVDAIWAGLRIAIGEEKEGWVVAQE